MNNFGEWAKKWTKRGGMNDRKDATHYSGFDGTVGKGWLPLLEALASILTAMGWDGDLHQVKEKYGTLRFYVGNSTPEMGTAISWFELMSGHVCERCGKEGKTRGGSWLRTICDACENSVNEEV